MKILFKLGIVCLLTFFITSIVRAQCGPVMTTNVVEISENATSATYRITVTTNSIADEIKLNFYSNGSKTCYNTNSCMLTAVVPKRCETRGNIFRCESKKGNCQKQDGCIVVINPLYCGE